MQNLYLSFDIEANGPAPGLNSMLAVGFAGFITEPSNCKLGEEKKLIFTFEANLHPLPDAKEDPDTMGWWQSQPEAWEYINTNKQDPKTVMTTLASEILELKTKYNIITVAWPAAYDWQWINYYFHRFVGNNPLGYSCRCIGSYGRALDIKGDLWDRYRDPNYPHTHKALDDAKEQGAMFLNLEIAQNQ